MRFFCGTILFLYVLGCYFKICRKVFGMRTDINIGDWSKSKCNIHFNLIFLVAKKNPNLKNMKSELSKRPKISKPSWGFSVIFKLLPTKCSKCTLESHGNLVLAFSIWCMHVVRNFWALTSFFQLHWFQIGSITLWLFSFFFELCATIFAHYSLPIFFLQFLHYWHFNFRIVTVISAKIYNNFQCIFCRKIDWHARNWIGFSCIFYSCAHIMYLQ